MRRILVIGIVAIVVVLLLSSTRTRKIGRVNDSLDSIDLAEKAWEEGNYREAWNGYHLAMKQDPESPIPHDRIATMCIIHATLVAIWEGIDNPTDLMKKSRNHNSIALRLFLEAKERAGDSDTLEAEYHFRLALANSYLIAKEQFNIMVDYDEGIQAFEDVKVIVQKQGGVWEKGRYIYAEMGIIRLMLHAGRIEEGRARGNALQGMISGMSPQQIMDDVQPRTGDTAS